MIALSGALGWVSSGLMGRFMSFALALGTMRVGLSYAICDWDFCGLSEDPGIF
jgi:hypothetical protein